MPIFLLLLLQRFMVIEGRSPPCYGFLVQKWIVCLYQCPVLGFTPQSSQLNTNTTHNGSRSPFRLFSSSRSPQTLLLSPSQLAPKSSLFQSLSLQSKLKSLLQIGSKVESIISNSSPSQLFAFLKKRTILLRMGKNEKPKHRVAFVLIDGLGDVSLPRFGYRTPLQVAKIPNLDAIASAGVNGLMDPVEPGLACGSDTAHLSLLGYDPRVYYRGRGAFESMGAGLAMSPGDIAFKSNFATWEEKTGIVTSRRADRHFEEEGPILCAALDGMKLPAFPEYEVRVRYATEHRCGVVVKGPKLSGNISGTDPLKDNRLLLKAEALDDTSEAKHTAAVVNELSKEISSILVSHPLNAKRAAEGKNIANIVLLRGCGIRIEVPPFEKKHGLWPCMVAPTKIIAGLGMSLGIDILEAPGATGDYRTLLTSKATAIARALSAPKEPCPNIFVPGEDDHKPGRFEGYDFGFLHIKAIDDAGHDKASIFKVKGLEAVDRAIGQLARLLWETESTGNFRYSLCVTGDHSTPVEYGDHSFEPVPFAICRLESFVRARGGDAIVMGTSLEPFPLPTVDPGEDLVGEVELKVKSGGSKALGGDTVSEFNEIAASRGCLGRFPGGEMMGIINAFLQHDV